MDQFSVDKFVSSIDKHKGLAPLNRFAAQITFPKGSKADWPQGEDTLYHCDTVPMPGRTVATSELRHYGPTRKIAREQTYGEISLGFILTNSHIVRHGFLKWIDSAVDPISGDISYQSEYKGQITVYMFAQDSSSVSPSEATSGVKYLEAFPTVVDPITLGWDQTNTVGKFNVTFHYKRWEPVSGAGGYTVPNEFVKETGQELTESGLAP